MECEKILGTGKILMNAETAPWPPLDASGEPIELGCTVFATHDTTCMQRDHEFAVGGLRLQNVGGSLRWVVCAYEDGMYVESYAEDCVVRRRAKPWRA